MKEKIIKITWQFFIGFILYLHCLGTPFMSNRKRQVLWDYEWGNATEEDLKRVGFKFL